jgi:hypothetical protein
VTNRQAASHYQRITYEFKYPLRDNIKETTCVFEMLFTNFLSCHPQTIPKDTGLGRTVGDKTKELWESNVLHFISK